MISENHTPFIHQTDTLVVDIVEGKASWALDAEEQNGPALMFYPGEYDDQARNSKITGPGMSFYDFLAAQLGASASAQETATATA
jgi:hypothetical protein